MTDLLAIGDRVVGWAGDDEAVEAVVVHRRDTDIRVYDGEIEQLSSAEALGVGVRVVVDGRQGFAYCGTFDDAALREALVEARDNATFASPDEHQAITAPDGVAPRDLDLWRDSVAAVPTDAKVALALELERATRAADPRITAVESCDYNDRLESIAVVTNTGIRARERSTACSIGAASLASDGDETQTGFGFSLGRELGDLDVDDAARDAADRAVRLLGAQKPETARLTVVLDPWVTAQLLAIVASTLSGEAVLKGRSPFADRVGDDVGSSYVTLVEDPTDAATMNAGAIDGEGLATRRVSLLESGVLQGFLHNSYTARSLGTSSTGSAMRGFKTTPGVGSRAVSLVPGTATQEELLASVGDGLLVQDVSGLHSGVNPISGDFSTGASGLRIRGGALAEPLREFTIASTLQRMLRDVAAVGGDLRRLPFGADGVSVVIHDVTVSGS